MASDQSSGSTSDGTAKPEEASVGDSPSESFQQAGSAISEAMEYAGYYAAARLDGVKHSVKRIGLWIVLGLVAAIAAVALVATAVVLVCRAIAQGLGQLFHSVWLGNLVTGVLILAILVGGVWWMKARLLRSWKRKTMDYYESRRNRQRERFGHDIQQRAGNGNV